MKVLADDGSLTDAHDLRKWNNLFIEGFAKMNRELQPGYHLRPWAENAGFVNVHEEKFKVPFGPWAKDPILKETGMMNLVQVLDGLEGFSHKIFELLGWSRIEIEVLLAKVRKDLKDPKIHTYVVL